MKNLLIVESPAKAKTIEKYLGSDFSVRASYGHIRDLPKDNHSVDIQHGFIPKYIVTPDKTAIVSELKRLTKQAERVWLATDEDREGEAISWHLLEVLGLNPKTTYRIVFHEITKPAIQKAIQNPRFVDMDLVNAQQARRVLDRLVGFELSPVIWKKVRPGLSAGRVQSVAVRLIAEREREIIEFKTTSYYKVAGEFTTIRGDQFVAVLNAKPSERAEAEDFLKTVIGASYQVGKLEKKPSKRSPAPPFTTSTLQQEASRKLGFSVAQTMRIAQSLYEHGHITYMRTDSVNLSDTALQAAQAEIIQLFGPNYHQRRQYKNKTANAQEAHEAIRPTNFSARQVSSDAQEQKLYDLIWKRTVASQMAEAQLEKTLVDILITPVQPVSKIPKFEAVGEVIVFDGFLKLYIEGKDDDNEDDDSRLLPQLNVGEAVTNRRITATERFTHHPPRYTEASLVKKMEELGIGRPSTYAPTISTIQKREYVVKESREGTDRPYTILTLEQNRIQEQKKNEKTGAEKNKLFPTDLGFIVTDFLVEYFTDIVDYKFTATVEESFDLISRGQLGWQQMLTDFYQPFHQRVELTAQAAERKAGDRYIGEDPKTGKPVIARLGRYGPLIQLGSAEDPDKRYVSLQPNQRIETITLAEALTLFQLPRNIGEVDGLVVKVNNGKFGPYIQHDGKFYSLPKEANLYTLSLEEAIAIMKAKQQADKEKILKSFPENANFQILNGRFGPYLLAEGHNVKLPKGVEPTSLTLAECEKLLENHLQSPAYLKKLAAQKAKLMPKRESIVRRFPESDWLIAVDRYGLYLFVDGDKLRLPKDRDAESFTLEELKDLWAKNLAKLKKKAETTGNTGKSPGGRGKTGGSKGRKK